MKQFWKMTLATVVGLLLFSMVSTIMSFMLFGIIAAAGNAPAVVSPNTVYHLKLEGSIVERSREDGLDYFMSMMDSDQAIMGLDDILSTIKQAKTDPNITGIFLECGNVSANPAMFTEIRNALADFGQEKPIVAYSDAYSQMPYYVASVANKVYVNPQGAVALTGVYMNSVFFKDALAKLGIEMQIFKVGTFKSAVEPYILNKMSEANRLQLETLSKGFWKTITSAISKSRSLSLDSLNLYANNGEFIGGTESALKYRLVDSLVYRGDLKKVISSVGGVDCKAIKFGKMKKVPVAKEKYSDNKVAVLYAYGAIDGGDEGEMKSSNIVEELVKLAEDDNVKAVVLRVNSPGGGVFGSEQMWQAVKTVKAKKPVVVSMGGMAASGGYYMSCEASKIVAQPNTITGSIGIFGMIPNIKGLSQKIGVNFDGVKTHNYADFGMIARSMTTQESALMQNYINKGYEQFVSRCATGRGKSTDDIKAIAEGRVWTGEDALKLGLVDTIGGLDCAIDVAVKLANVSGDYNVKTYPVKKDFITTLMEDFGGDVEGRILQHVMGSEYEYVKMVNRVKNMSGLQAIYPYFIEIQ